MRRRYMNTYLKGFYSNMILPIISVGYSSYTAIIVTQNNSGQVDAKKYLNDDSFKLVYSSLEDQGIMPKVQTNRTDGGRSLLARLNGIADNHYGIFIYEVTYDYGKFYMCLYKHSDFNAKKLLSDIEVHNTVNGAVYITHPSLTTG